MAYSTGSGDYVALMAAVLAHALADGWTEVGGLATGWPIQSPNSGFYADWATDTVATTDVTIGGIGISTQRNIRMGLDYASSATATSEAASGEVVSPNADFNITAWHIFSEPALCDYISVAFEFSNGPDASVWSHFSFGEIDQYGLTHGGVLFAGGQYGRGWAVNTFSGNAAGDWNSINRTNMAFAGSYGGQDDGGSQLEIKINNTSHPIPAPGPGVGGWPATATRLKNGSFVWSMSRPSVDLDGPNYGTANVALNWHATAFLPMPFVGSVTLMPMPIFLLNGTSSGSSMLFLGQIPNARLCSMNGFNPGDEVTFGGDIWKLFPMLCQKADSTLNSTSIVTSGQCGYAYKKVS